MFLPYTAWEKHWKCTSQNLLSSGFWVRFNEKHSLKIWKTKEKGKQLTSFGSGRQTQKIHINFQSHMWVNHSPWCYRKGSSLEPALYNFCSLLISAMTYFPDPCSPSPSDSFLSTPDFLCYNPFLLEYLRYLEIELFSLTLWIWLNPNW